MCLRWESLTPVFFFPSLSLSLFIAFGCHTDTHTQMCCAWRQRATLLLLLLFFLRWWWRYFISLSLTVFFFFSFCSLFSAFSPPVRTTAHHRRQSLHFIYVNIYIFFLFVMTFTHDIPHLLWKRQNSRSLKKVRSTAVVRMGSEGEVVERCGGRCVHAQKYEHLHTGTRDEKNKHTHIHTHAQNGTGAKKKKKETTLRIF